METNYIIYKVENNHNQKVFIGRSKMTLDEVKIQHWRNYNHHIKKGMSLSKLYQAFKSEQWDSFTWSVVASTDNKDDAKLKLKQWRTYYNSVDDGLNQMNGFKKGHTHSDAHRQQLKQLMTERFAHEASRTAKLTEEDVVYIRHMYSKFDVTQLNLANQFGVTVGNISHIINKRSWQYI